MSYKSSLFNSQKARKNRIATGTRQRISNIGQAGYIRHILQTQTSANGEFWNMTK